MSSYEVGSVIWVIHSDRPGLMAYQVIEEITKKDLDGENVHYIVRPARPKAKSVQLSSIQGQIFLNSEEAQVVLLENATKAIDGIITKTQALVDKFFHPPKEEAAVSTPVRPKRKSSKKQKDEKLPDGYAWVEMEDGKKVKMKIPEELL